MIEDLAEKGFDYLEETGNLMMTKKAKSAITSAATYSALVSLIPLGGFETIIIAIILWNMYKNICSSMKVPFSFSSILGGFATNIIVCFVFNALFDWIVLLGWIITAVGVWIVTYYSGKVYLGTLTTIYKNSSAHKDRINSQIEKAQVKEWTGLTWHEDGITDAISKKGDFSQDLNYCIEHYDFVIEHLDAFEKRFKFFLQPAFLDSCSDPHEEKCAYNFLLAALTVGYLREHMFTNEQGETDWERINKATNYAEIGVNGKNNPEEARRFLRILSVWKQSTSDEELYRCYCTFPKATDDNDSYFSASTQNNLWDWSIALAILHHSNNLRETDLVKCAQSARFWSEKFNFTNSFNPENPICIMWINELESLGYFYQEGEGGIEPNYPEAHRIWNLTIKLADSEKAKANLAEMYELGKGVEQDKTRAKSLYLEVLNSTEEGSPIYQEVYSRLHPKEGINEITGQEIPCEIEAPKAETSTSVDTSEFSIVIEDMFSINGRGTVVTGQIATGAIHTGDTVRIYDGDSYKETIVIGIEAYRKLLDFAKKGDNIGLLLKGIEKSEVKVGNVVCSPKFRK